MSKQRMQSHLKETYGFNQFRAHQDEIISKLLDGKNVFAVLPTGGGKSLLYQFPATYTGKTTVIISPLISLMNDQCKFLNSRNIPSVCLNSETCVDIGECQKYKLIYTTPEFLTKRVNLFEQIVKNIGLFAIDEAHCVSQWSHDFRPSYLSLNVITETFSSTPVLAVTATATPHVVGDIVNLLGMKNVSMFSLGTRRTNLEISVLPKTQFDFCEFTEPTIVYVQTKKMCEKICDELTSRGYSCGKYHGGLSKDTKAENHTKFANGELLIIVATVSFGMGIDKSDIRHVVNYGVPNDIETYYQEIGRAGRDGVLSKASLYYDSKDFFTAKFLIQSSSNQNQVALRMAAMNIFRQFLEEKNICRQQILDYYFENGTYPTCQQIRHIPACGICDNCKNKNDTVDVTKETVAVISAINGHLISSGFAFGIEKTTELIQNLENPLFTNKPKGWVKSLIQALITQGILIKKKTQKGFVIHANSPDEPITGPIDIRLDMGTHSSKNSHQGICRTLQKLRLSMSRKYGMAPSVFMNDRVLSNIEKSKPQTVCGLQGVDGISRDFITKYGEDFMAQYNQIYNSTGQNELGLQLKQYRARISKENCIPLYCVFHNSTITDILQKCPRNKESLLAIKGLGKTKVEKYGDDIIDMCLIFQQTQA